MWYPPWLVTRIQFIIAEDQLSHWTLYLKESYPAYSLIHPPITHNHSLRKLNTGLVSQSLPVWSNPSSDAQTYIWVSRSVGYPPPPSFVYNYKIRMPTGRRVWRFSHSPTCGRVWRLSAILPVDEYDDSPPSHLKICYLRNVARHLSLSLPRLHLSLFWSLLRPRGHSRVTFEAAMHIASLCRVRSDTMDITCHPNIFLHVGSPQVPNPDPLVMVLLTRARVAVSATFAMVGGGPKWPPPSDSKTRKARRPDDTAIDRS